MIDLKALTVEQIRQLMKCSTNIRNMSVIGDVDHGKSTLISVLVSNAGINTPAMAQENKWPVISENLVRIQPAALPLRFEFDKEGEAAIKQKHEGLEFLINLIDSPGQVDFSSEVTAALRVTDGALLVVDCIEGVCVQTQMVLRRVLGERIKPVLVLNKVDLALEMDKESLFQLFSSTVESVNAVMSTYNDAALGDVQVYPETDTVAFGSGLHGWCFTLGLFAKRYAKKFGVDQERMMAKLWGDNFFNPVTKKWTTKSTDADGNPLERAFNQFILEPIFRILDAVLSHRKDETFKICEKLEITLRPEESDLEGRQLVKAIMRRFLPAHQALLEMVVINLPSPATAQRYRVESLYEGPMDDESAIGIRDCDPNGPLVCYISKMVSSSDNGRFYAFGRVFSGTVCAGLKIRIQGPNYVPGKKDDLFVKAIERTVLTMGRFAEPIEDCPAGNIIGIVGIDQFLLKGGTLTTSETAHNMKVMKFSTSPVVQCVVDVKNPADLPKLVDGLQRLSKSDPCVQVSVSEIGGFTVAGAGELHLEICLKKLQETGSGVPLEPYDPVVAYRETVRAKSSITAHSKTQNEHNHLYAMAAPVDEELTKAMESGKVSSTCKKTNIRARVLADEFGWDVAEARKIWCFGPDATGPNLLVDTTKDVQYLNDIKDTCVAAFQWATMEGVLCGEQMRGVRVNVMDATLHTDAIHRGDGQVIPMCRRVISAACLLAEPTLQEPIFFIEVQCPKAAISGVYSVLDKRRGQVLSEEQRPGMSILTVKAYLPVKNAFGFSADLHEATRGQAFHQSVLDHWELVDGSAFEKGSKLEELIVSIRVRKGYKAEVPSLNTLYDQDMKTERSIGLRF